MLTALVSNEGNHSPVAWASGTASTILQLDPYSDRGEQVEHLRLKSAAVLSRYFHDVLEKERDNLLNNFDHCDQPYKVELLAKEALSAVQFVAQDTPWADKLLNDPDWIGAAYQTIADHMVTAIHVERLLHADNNPNNAAAQAYKLKHTG